jgi:hypothetical protein
VETPVFNRHIVVHADPVNALLAVHENHHADDFDFFVDQEIPELIVGLVHADIMKESDTKAKKIKLFPGKQAVLPSQPIKKFDDYTFMTCHVKKAFSETRKENFLTADKGR